LQKTILPESSSPKYDCIFSFERLKTQQGPNSLMRAISDGIHHTPQLFASIQESLVNHLKEMVSKNVTKMHHCIKFDCWYLGLSQKTWVVI